MERKEEKNKYYTPKLEEFCIGFEFEMYNFAKGMVRDPSDHPDFVKCIFTGDELYNFSFIKYFLNNGDNVRVKHLSKEDIESLGFIPYPLLEERDTWTFPGGDSYITAINKFKDCRIDRWEDQIAISIQVVGQPKRRLYVFMGKIKNKSELMKIIKMTGVLGDE